MMRVGGIVHRALWTCFLMALAPTASWAGPYDGRPVERHQFALQLHAQQERIISEIISTIDNTHLMLLGFQASHLHRLGDQLGEIGVFQFMGYIFSQPQLKQSMRKIHSSWGKWQGFMGGLAPRIESECHKENFVHEVTRFAHFLRIDPNVLLHCAHNRDWDGFVGRLVEAD